MEKLFTLYALHRSYIIACTIAQGPGLQSQIHVKIRVG